MNYPFKYCSTVQQTIDFRVHCSSNTDLQGWMCVSPCTSFSVHQTITYAWRYHDHEFDCRGLNELIKYVRITLDRIVCQMHIYKCKRNAYRSLAIENRYRNKSRNRKVQGSDKRKANHRYCTMSCFLQHCAAEVFLCKPLLHFVCLY